MARARAYYFAWLSLDPVMRRIAHESRFHFLGVENPRTMILPRRELRGVARLRGGKRDEP